MRLVLSWVFYTWIQCWRRQALNSFWHRSSSGYEHFILFYLQYILLSIYLQSLHLTFACRFYLFLVCALWLIPDGFIYIKPVGNRNLGTSSSWKQVLTFRTQTVAFLFFFTNDPTTARTHREENVFSLSSKCALRFTWILFPIEKINFYCKRKPIRTKKKKNIRPTWDSNLRPSDDWARRAVDIPYVIILSKRTGNHAGTFIGEWRTICQIIYMVETDQKRFAWSAFKKLLPHFQPWIFMHYYDTKASHSGYYIIKWNK